MGPDEQGEASETREWGRWTKKPQEQAGIRGGNYGNVGREIQYEYGLWSQTISNLGR